MVTTTVMVNMISTMAMESIMVREKKKGNRKKHH